MATKAKAKGFGYLIYSECPGVPTFSLDKATAKMFVESNVGLGMVIDCATGEVVYKKEELN